MVKKLTPLQIAEENLKDARRRINFALKEFREAMAALARLKAKEVNNDVGDTVVAKDLPDSKDFWPVCGRGMVVVKKL